MSTWTVRAEVAMGSITAHHNGEGRADPPDRYEDHADWRVFFNGDRVVAARNDPAFHHRLDLGPIVSLVPANVVAELRRIADGLLRNPADTSSTVKSAT